MRPTVLFSGLTDPAVPMRDGISADSLLQAPDSLHSLFTTKRPDVLFIIMESFSSWLMTTLGGEPGVAVQLDSLAQEGVLFTNFLCEQFPHRPRVGCHIERVSGTAHYQHNEVSP